MTRHPQAGKAGVNISKQKYETVKNAILEALRASGGEMTFADLAAAVRSRLEDSFEGSVSWYVTTVKLDLEARRIIERAPESSPQRLRLVKA